MKSLDCWWEYFDIAGYLRSHYSSETVEKMMRARPKPKTVQLVELIQQAQRRLNKR